MKPDPGSILSNNPQKSPQTLSGKKSKSSKMNAEDLKRLIQELQIRQADLEKENEELHKVQKEFETLTQNAPDAIFHLSSDLRLLFVNKKLLESIRKPKSELLGKTARELGLPVHLCNLLKEIVQEVFTSHLPVEFEIPLIGSEGCRHFQVRLVPEIGTDGEVESTIGIARDITELKQKEEELKSAHAFYKAIEESILVGIAAVDTEGRQSYINPALCKMVGWSQEELLGAKPPFLYWPPEEIEKIQNSFKVLLDSKESSETLELRFRRKNGERFDTLVLYSPLKDGQGKLIGWIGSIGDITKHKRREEEIRRLNVELEERVRQRTAELENLNKELEAFCYAVSHDLKSPLIVINGFCQRLLERYGDKLDAKGKKYLQNVYEAAQHMTLLIEDLLSLSKVTQSGMKLKTIDLSELVKSIVGKLQEVDSERQVEYVIQEGLVAKGDSRLLRIALENLLGNAWKFTNKQPKPTIEFGLSRMESEPIYFVHDNGCGFDMALADKIFEPFQRLHPPEEFPGTGIDLSTVKRIIHRHGGRIWAESNPGKGATFFFTIPS